MRSSWRLSAVFAAAVLIVAIIVLPERAASRRSQEPERGGTASVGTTGRSSASEPAKVEATAQAAASRAAGLDARPRPRAASIHPPDRGSSARAQQPQWAVPFGEEFWRQSGNADPRNGVRLSAGTPPPTFDVGDVIERVNHAVKTRADGQGFSVDAIRYRADSGPNGLRITPRTESAAAGGPDAANAGATPSFIFRTLSITSGGHAVYDGVSGTTDAPLHGYGNTVQKLLNSDVGLVEHYEMRDQGVEVSWILDQSPGQGESLVVEGEIAGVGKGEAMPDGLSFVPRNGSGRLLVGQVLAVDSSGQQWTVPMESPAAGRVRLTIPSSIMAAARFPLAIDPLISYVGFINPDPAEPNEYGTILPDEVAPQVVFNANANMYLVGWRTALGQPDYFTSTVNYDSYTIARIASGVLLDPGGIAFTDATYAAISPLGANFCLTYQVGSTNIRTRVLSVANPVADIWPPNNVLYTAMPDRWYALKATSDVDTNVAVLISSSRGDYYYGITNDMLVVMIDGSGQPISTATYSDAMAWPSLHSSYHEATLSSGGTNIMVLWSKYDGGNQVTCKLLQWDGGALVKSANVPLAIPADGYTRLYFSSGWLSSRCAVAWSKYLFNPPGGDDVDVAYGVEGVVIKTDGSAAGDARVLYSATNHNTNVAHPSEVQATAGSTNILISYIGFADTQNGSQAYGPGTLYGRYLGVDGNLQGGQLVLEDDTNLLTAVLRHDIAYDGSAFCVAMQKWSNVRGEGSGPNNCYDASISFYTPGDARPSDNPEMLLAPASVNYESPALGWDGNQYLLVYNKQQADPVSAGVYEWPLYGVRVSADGIPLDPSGTALGINEGAPWPLAPSLHYGRAGHYLLTWNQGLYYYGDPRPRNGLWLTNVECAVIGTVGAIARVGTVTPARNDLFMLGACAWSDEYFSWLVSWSRLASGFHTSCARVYEDATLLDPLPGVSVGRGFSSGVASDGTNFVVARDDDYSDWDELRVRSVGAASGSLGSEWALSPTGTAIVVSGFNWVPSRGAYVLDYTVVNPNGSLGSSNYTAFINASGAPVTTSPISTTNIPASGVTYWTGSHYIEVDVANDALRVYDDSMQLMGIVNSNSYASAAAGSGATRLFVRQNIDPASSSWRPELYNIPLLPLVRYSVSPTSPSAESNVVFSASQSHSVVPGRPIVLIQWDYNNDGNYDASGTIVTNVYPTGGSKVVRLRVTDQDQTTFAQSQVTLVFTVNMASVVVPMSNPVVDTQNGTVSLQFQTAGGGQLYDVYSTTDPFSANPTWNPVEQNSADGQISDAPLTGSLQYFRVVKAGEPPDQNGLWLAARPQVSEGYTLMAAPSDGPHAFAGTFGAQLAEGLTPGDGLSDDGDRVHIMENGLLSVTLLLKEVLGTRIWVDSTSPADDPSPYILDPGQGYLVERKTPGTVSLALVGPVGNTGADSVDLGTGWNLVTVSEGKPVSVAAAFETADPDASYDIAEADEVFIQGANQAWKRLIRIPKDGAGEMWLDTQTGLEANLTLQPGQAYYYKRKGGATTLEF